MPASKYSRLADSLAGGDWTTERPYPDWGNGAGDQTATREEMQVAALIDIMISLRAIRRRLDCPNVTGAAVALAKLARQQRTTEKAKAAAARRKVKVTT